MSQLDNSSPPASSASAAASTRAPSRKNSLATASDDSVDPVHAMFTGYNNKKRVTERYKIVGFISSGTYGRVYKAEGKNGRTGEFAIKK
ncbi:cyclin-dependent protein kinase-like protein Ssn3 [Alternaria alternata]|nr:cyclin-dependent protein kinase-like protein Ssn3 [Alternaria alternata]